jgi:ubiquinone/menaquinone biosynthesis C-methylase UbiE
MRDPTNQRFWQRIAGLYTTFHEKTNRDIYDLLCRRISPHLTPDMHILELACGTGQMTRPLAPRVAAWEATDYADKMVRETKKHVRLANVTFDVQDATRLTYADASFDGVVIANALHIMPHPELALENIRRVLRPTGLLIAPTFVHEGKINRFRLWFMGKIGFRTYHQWTRQTYIQTVEAQGFDVLQADLIQGRLLPACLLLATPRSTDV